MTISASSSIDIVIEPQEDGSGDGEASAEVVADGAGASVGVASLVGVTPAGLNGAQAATRNAATSRP